MVENSPQEATSTLQISPDRSSPQRLRQAANKVQAENLVAVVLEAVPGFAMILDEYRQIVAANRRLLETVGAQSLEDILGKRPGDAVGCRNAVCAPDGCGSAASCIFCGAVQTVIRSQVTQTHQVGECRIPLADPRGGTVDAEVIAMPAVIDGMSFTVVTMRDISSEKRRQILERVFFHDVLNTAGGMRGLVSVLREDPSSDEEQGYMELLDDLCDQLVEVINQQRELLSAESGELATHPMFVSVPSLLLAVKKIYERHEASVGRQVEVGVAPDVDVVTDMRLARRVLENMVKNAIEATPVGATVQLDAEDLGEEVAIRVHNPGVILEPARHQIFQRSFSTKGANRGLGTYSMRLLGEGYLGGEVAFTSSEERGTTFVFLIPKSWKGRSDESW